MRNGLEDAGATRRRGERGGVGGHRGPAVRAKWPTKRLGEVCELISGQHIEAKDYNADRKGVAYLTGPSDFGERTPVVTKWTEFPKRMAQSGDVLITVKGSGVGKINFLDTEVAISRQLMAIRPHGINTEFLYSFLWAHFGHFQTISTGAAIPGISREDILKLECPVPSPQEQQRIVAILDEAFEGIATAKANAEKNLQNAREVFENHLESILGMRGDGWNDLLLGELCSFENGDRGTNYPSKSARTATGIPFINAGHLSEDGLNHELMDYISRDRYDLLSNGKVRAGDILFCLRGSLGKFASVGDLNEGAIASSLVIIRPGKYLLNEYVLAYLGSSLCAGMINKFKNGAAQPNLSAQSLRSFVIPVPPIPGQKSIIRRHLELRSETQRLVAIYQQKLTVLEELKQSLLHRAFNGDL